MMLGQLEEEEELWNILEKLKKILQKFTEQELFGNRRRRKKTKDNFMYK